MKSFVCFLVSVTFILGVFVGCTSYYNDKVKEPFKNILAEEQNQNNYENNMDISNWEKYTVSKDAIIGDQNSIKIDIELKLPSDLSIEGFSIVDNSIKKVNEFEPSKKVADFLGGYKLEDFSIINPFFNKQEIEVEKMQFIYPDSFILNIDSPITPCKYNENLDLNTYFTGNFVNNKYIAFIHNNYYPTIDGDSAKVIEFAVINQEYLYKLRFYIKADLNDRKQIEIYEKIIATSKIL